jgi:hypothetical protein
LILQGDFTIRGGADRRTLRCASVNTSAVR